MAMDTSKKPVPVWQIAKVNLKHNFLPLLLLSIIVMLLTPVLFGTTNLDRRACAVPLEMLIATIGMILLVPIFQPEQNREIEDIVGSKYVDIFYVYLIRVVYSIIGIVLMVLMFSDFLFIRGCEINAELMFGTIADAMFLGAIGLFVAAVTNNLTVAFMIPILYYLLNMTLQSKLGHWNLFAMIKGEYKPNVWLLTTSVILIMISIVVKRVIDRVR